MREKNNRPPLKTLLLILSLCAPHALASKPLPISIHTTGMKHTAATTLVAQGSTVLEAGKPIQRELNGGGAHAYTVNVAAGQFASIVAEQRSVDVVVVLFSPSGAQLKEVDSPNGTEGPETVAFVAHESGAYRIEVRALDKTAPAGRYEIRVDALRAATKADRTTDLAERLLAAKTEDERASLQAAEPELITTDLLASLHDLAIPLYQNAQHEQAFAAFELEFKLAEKLGSKDRMAAALNAIGVVHEAREEYDQALDYYHKSIALIETLPNNKAKLAQMYYNVGNGYRFKGDFAHGLESYRKSQSLYEEVGNKHMVTVTRNSVGLSYNLLGNQTVALENYQKSLAELEAMGDTPNVVETLAYIGSTHAVLGRYAPALEAYRRALKLSEGLGNPYNNLSFLTLIGLIYYDQGDYAHALETYTSEQQIAEKLENKSAYAQALLDVGDVLRAQGDNARAEENYRQALKLAQTFMRTAGTGRLQDRIGIARILNSLGETAVAMGDDTHALEFFQQSLKLFEDAPVEFVVEGTTTLLNNIGSAYARQGNNAEAQKYFQRALELSERIGHAAGVARTLNSLAGISRAENDPARALEQANRATQIARDIGDRETFWAARTSAGEALRARGDFAGARAAFEEAIATVESLRAGFVAQQARASYFAKVRKPYEAYVDLLMQLHRQHPADGNDTRALEASERARARTLLEALTEAGADIRAGVEPSLLARERELQQRLNAAARRQVKFVGVGRGGEEQSSAIKREIDELSASLQDVQSEIRRASPRYAALTQPAPLGVGEMQRQLVDADTLLLEYALGEERSYLWAVTPTSVKTYELPARALIEKSAREVYDLLTLRNRGGRGLTDDPQFAAQSDAKFAVAAARLSAMVLAPVANELGTKRLLVVSDGALQYVPFAALPDPAADAKARQPLVVAHEIVSLPSASVLAVLRQETRGRARAPKAVAVLADPVFEQDDERVKPTDARGATTRAVSNSTTGRRDAGDTNAAETRSIVERALGSTKLNDATGAKSNDAAGATRDHIYISRLPFTRREAQAILTTVAAAEGMQALDFRASRETAMGGELSQYRIVHFATHGILNSEHPELSGVVLSLVNEQGQPTDGFLRLHEIYNLKLPAELVVLSACQTALGKEIRGEGLVGLVRGFMYAGAPRVMASLWKVDDLATAELMKRFYQSMLKDGLRPAAALRAAQRSMWEPRGAQGRRDSQERWRDPYYWAAFQLQGEWK
jgi:CHAT domain-containing protein/tetratricopeptide (TPR) repeat protein